MLLSCLHDMQRHPLPTLIISCTNRNRKKSHSRISSRRLHCFFANRMLCSSCSCIIYTLPPALSDLPVLVSTAPIEPPLDVVGRATDGRTLNTGLSPALGALPPHSPTTGAVLYLQHSPTTGASQCCCRCCNVQGAAISARRDIWQVVALRSSRPCQSRKCH